VPDFQLPTIRQRVAVIGSNGTGKTQFAVWLLSLAPFDVQPYIIVDYKREELINSIERIRQIDIGEIPKHPGLYVVQPRPRVDDENVERMLENVYEHERVGLYFDEGYMVPDKAAFPAILTQGRSKFIPSIILTQRPSWISRFVFSEANHYALFHLSDGDDRKTMRRFMPANVDLTKPLPRFHSWYYTVGEQDALALAPVPDADTLRETIDERLAPQTRRRVV
jgi:DNA helicase HerA-like ATPase